MFSDLGGQRDGGGGKAAHLQSARRGADDPELAAAADEAGAHHHHGYGSTRGDTENMRRMGRSQELVRRFRLWSIMSFAALATAAWELAVFGVSPALVDGGRPGLLYSSVWCFLGFGPVYLSMSEMASMAPTAGAQYHWVSEFAPESVQKTSTLAWQAGNAWGLILIGTLLQSIVMVNSEAYAESAPSWHGTVIVIGVSILAVAANVFGAKWLPYWQNGVFVLHIAAYAGFIIPIWVNAPKASHSQVWGSWEDRGGWPSMGLSIMVGQLPALASQTAVHMAEEVRNASVSIPRVMMATWVFNYITIFVALVTIAYHMPDIGLALEDATGYPVIFVLRNSMPLPWLNVVLVVILLLLIFGNLSYLASVTRDLFAFARDKGLPFSDWIGKVDPKRSIPTNACVVTGTTTALLSLVYIGSPVAFYAVISLSTVAILQCYCLSIGCLLWRRIAYPETLPPAAFSLGVWGVPVNTAAVLFSFYSFFWCFWPQQSSVTAGAFNWASPLFVLIGIIALAYYFMGGRKRYHGPVVHVQGRKTCRP
ncbi:GABA permease [Cordyceps javanica]|nr:GABA permease [Cordyceps javanica]